MLYFEWGDYDHRQICIKQQYQVGEDREMHLEDLYKIRIYDSTLRELLML